MSTLIQILIFIAIALVALFGYSFLNIYVLRKFRPNKWIILAIAILMLVCPFIITIATGHTNIIVQLVFSIAFILLILWFIDLHQYGKNKKNIKQKEIQIKPKAKPNRAKKNNK